ncbi:uncharacterized protein LOC134264452 [Saccostrea cucullata]|uniref:uncharacterized protein LOC134264452 n=1 Tax=Saccostrea cuccullata TaxID=36930 RepID=UPI002ED2C22F
MAVAPDPSGQHFVTCQLCEDNVQFYCRPCRIRLCVKCVSPHLETNAPDHNIVYYHKRFWTTTRFLHDPHLVKNIPCGCIAMLCIRYTSDRQIFVISHGSSDINLVNTDGTLVRTFSPERLLPNLTPYKDGALYTDKEGIRKINSKDDKLFISIHGELRGIEFMEPNFIFVCNSSKVEKYTTDGKRLLKIEYDDKGDHIYKNPTKISINGNGDICVAEYARTDVLIPSVTVVDNCGKYRFSYGLEPKSDYSCMMDLCCDSCFHIIIVCDKIQVIDKDGNFLRYLVYDGIKNPLSVTIDNDDNLYVSELFDKYVRVLKYLY